MTKPELNEKLLEALWTQLKDQAICPLDDNGNIADWNSGAEKFYNLSPGNALGAPGSVLFIDAPFDEALSYARSSGQYDGQWQLNISAPLPQLVSVSLQTFLFEDQLKGFTLFTCRSGSTANTTDDIPPPIWYEKELFDSVPDIICIVGTDRKFKRVNKAMCQLLEYEELELLQKQIDDLIYPADLAESKLRMQKFKNDEIEVLYFENRYNTKSKNVLHLAWTVRKSPEKGVLFCVAKDITEKNKLEYLLQRTNELARIGSWEIDVAEDTVFWSNITSEIIEAADDHKPHRNDATHFYGPEELAKVNAAMVRLLEHGEPFDIEVQLKTFKNNKLWVRVLAEAEFEHGQCRHIYGSIQDIDVRKRSQLQLLERTEALADSGRRYSELFQMSPLPMFVFDVETLRYLNVNKAAIKHYGYSRKEFLKMTIRDIRPASEMSKLDAVINDIHRNDHQFKPGVFTHIKKNGEIIQVEVVSSAIKYLNKNARLTLITDVTEQKRHLAEIEAKNKKLQDISWMQSHIIRAPLSRIMGLIHLLQDTDPDKDSVAEIISYIKLSAEELDMVIHNITANAASITEAATDI